MKVPAFLMLVRPAFPFALLDLTWVELGGKNDTETVNLRSNVCSSRQVSYRHKTEKGTTINTDQHHRHKNTKHGKSKNNNVDVITHKWEEHKQASECK